jgi:hypothetical protein
MLAALRGRASDRKLRLFVAACCRRVWHLLTDDRSRGAVEAQERYADGAAPAHELRAAQSAALAAAESDESVGAPASAKFAAAEAGFGAPARGRARATLEAEAGAYDAAKFAAEAAGLDGPGRDRPGGWHAGRDAEQGAQGDLLRDLFGNPFRPGSADPSWLTPTAVALAQTIYADRAFDRLPLLADALMDAGCDSEDILTHCRSAGPHVRGCWVVDLVLGLE